MDFLSLPATIVSNVLNKLGRITDVVRLDSAYCHHHHRTIWLELLGSKGFTMSCPVNLSNTDALSWMFLKDAKCLSVEFSSDMGACKDISNFLRTSGSAIRTVHFKGGTKHLEMVLVALHCRNLFEIYASGIEMSFTYKEILLRNPGIQKIWCSDVKCSEEDIFAGVTLHKLQTIEICGVDCLEGFPWHESASSNSLHTVVWNDCAFRSSNLRSMVKNCPSIRSFGADYCNFGYDDTFLPGHGLQKLSIYNNETITDPQLLSMVTNLTSLRALNIQRCALLTDLSLQHIAEHVGDRLEKLYVDSKHPESAETEAILEVFSQKCTNLKYLSIHCGDNHLCAGKGTSALVCGCPALRTLVVNKANAICPTSRVLVAKLRPDLTILVHDKSTKFDILSF